MTNEYISYLDGTLYWMGKNVSKLVTSAGTPSLIYSVERMIDNLEWLSNAVKAAHENYMIAVAIKAIGNSKIVSSFKNKDLCCEVMSEEEYVVAKRMGFTPKQIVINGLGWSKQFIELMCKDQPLIINVDNISDCRRLNACAQNNKVVLPISLRIVPQRGKSFATLDEKLGTIPKFAEENINEIKKMQGVSIVSISVHALHRCADLSELKEIIGEITDYTKNVELLPSLKYIDIGGGLESRYKLERNNITLIDLSEALRDVFKEVPENVGVILEPGRFIVGDAAIALGMINTIKHSINKKWVIVDTGTNFLVPIDTASFEVFSVTKNEKPILECYVADGICSPTSVISEHCFLTNGISENDYIAIGNAGAYTLALHENWGYSMPSVYLMDPDGNLVTVVSRERAKRFFVEFWELSED